jgi:hypothetical protein
LISAQKWAFGFNRFIGGEVRIVSDAQDLSGKPGLLLEYEKSRWADFNHLLKAKASLFEGVQVGDEPLGKLLKLGTGRSVRGYCDRGKNDGFNKIWHPYLVSRILRACTVQDIPVLLRKPRGASTEI